MDQRYVFSCKHKWLLTNLGMVTSHIRPNKHFTLLPRRESGQNLIDGGCLRSHQSIVLRCPGWDVWKQVAIKFSVLGPLNRSSVKRGIGRIKRSSRERWRYGIVLTPACLCCVAGVSSLVSQEVIDGCYLLADEREMGAGDVMAFRVRTYIQMTSVSAWSGGFPGCW